MRLAVITRLGWIRRQQAKFDKQDRQSERQIVSGESHYVRGRRYRLDVIADDARPISVRNNSKLEVPVRPGTSRLGRDLVLQKWDRQQLRNQLPQLVAKWESTIGVKVAETGSRE